MKKRKTAIIVEIGALAALSTVLYVLRFSLPIFPPFLQLQFSNLPIIVGGFTLGPLYGILVLVIKTLVSIIVRPTASAYVGTLADFIIGLIVLLVTSFIYKKTKSNKGSIIALICGTLAWIGSAVIANWFILIPFYIKQFYQGDIVGLLADCAIIPGINESNYMIKYMLYACIPFNLIISIVVSIVTFLVYRRIENLIK